MARNDPGQVRSAAGQWNHLQPEPDRVAVAAQSASGTISPMARGSSTPSPPDDAGERIVDVDVSEEMRGSFLEYAYSVIYQRALPDARDGLKPVQRRILHQMNQMGLRPDRGHVKSSRVVGDVMGKLHPHGDSAIYDALVRMAQPFAMRAPLVDGHGNFGSLGGDDAPAAMRYTEARPAPAAMLMVASLGEDVVDFAPNYDGRDQEPEVLPAAFPNLLVNGAAGIAVGMATNMPPHNLAEVAAAARHLIHHPGATVDDLVRFVPGPDLPTGGTIVGLDGVREAYASGRGTFRTRAAARVENLTARRSSIVVTALPYAVGPEKVISRIQEMVSAKKLAGISDVKDLTDREHGLRLSIEIKGGYNPEAVLEELYRLTPMEESFGINNVALVDGQPRTLGLKELLEVYVGHRFEVVRRRCAHRRRRREERVHLVDGLLVALADIDEVIRIIRSSEDTAHARERLMEIFDLTQVQATHILDTPLRRLTKYDRLELERERETLQNEIAEFTAVLSSEERLRSLVSDELAEVARDYGTPRRTTLVEASGAPAAAAPLEIPDDPCRVLLSATGLLARSAPPAPPSTDGPRAGHDAVLASVPTTVRAAVGAVTSTGRLVWVNVLDLPALPATGGLGGGAPASEFVDLAPGESVVALTAAVSGEAGAGLAVGTARGVVKRIAPGYPQHKSEFEVIGLGKGDRVIGAVDLDTGGEHLTFVTSDAQLLTFPAASVRPQGRAAGGVAGVRLAASAEAVWFGAVAHTEGAQVVTVAGSADAPPGPRSASVKVTPYAAYPAKGRATGGVRCHRFLRGENTLVLAWVGPMPRALTSAGEPVELPETTDRRDGSGTPLNQPPAFLGAAPGGAESSGPEGGP